MNTELNQISINGVEYVRKDFYTQNILAPLTDKKLRIVSVDNRGLAFVGKVSFEEQGEWLTIEKARCVIYWGTTNHIAELVNGPTPKTKLGMEQTVRVRKENVVFIYDCVPECWSNFYN